MISCPAALPLQYGRTSPWEEAVLAPQGPVRDQAALVPRSATELCTSAPWLSPLHWGEGVDQGTQ